ncbi:MAG: hypothetical protein ABL864_01370 [Terricaulis sp.]
MKSVLRFLMVCPFVACVLGAALAQEGHVERWSAPSGKFSLDLASHGWMAAEGGNGPDLFGYDYAMFLPSNFGAEDMQRLVVCGVRQNVFPIRPGATQQFANDRLGALLPSGRAQEDTSAVGTGVINLRSYMHDGVRVFGWTAVNASVREHARAFVLVEPWGATYTVVSCLGGRVAPSEDISQFEAILNSLSFRIGEP